MTGLNLFQEVQLVSASPTTGFRAFFAAQLTPLWEKDSAFTAYNKREGPNESSQFQGVPEAIFSCLVSCLKGVQAGWMECSFLEITVTQQGYPRELRNENTA